MNQTNIIINNKVKSLDVLFINLPAVSPDICDPNDATIAESLTPPLGLLYLANSIKDCSFVNSYQGIDFAICDYSRCVESSDLVEFVQEKLSHDAKNQPAVVAISLMFSSSYDFFRVIINEIKKYWDDVIIIVGGIHASNTVEYLLKNNNAIDYVVCGEGEESFVEFLEMISTGSKKDISGVHSLNNIKKISKNSFEQTKYVDRFDIDYTKYSKLIDMGIYTGGTSFFSLSKTTLSVRAFSIMASRGCPYHCTFCASYTVHGKKSRWRSFENLKEEIYYLNKKYGVTKFYLIDDNFVPKSMAVKLFTMLSEINTNIVGFEIVIQNMSINATNYEIIDAIVSAGINNIGFAIESGSEFIQKKIKKNVKLDKAFKLVDYSRKKGLNVRCFYIIGFPNETVAQMEETFRYAKLLGADWSSFSVASPIPGTEMYDEFVELGYIKDNPSSWSATTLRDRVFDTKEINKEDIKDLAYRANLEVNFVNNINIRDGDYENAEVIFTNFVKQFDFHIFAYDCLRRVYSAMEETEKENSMIVKINELLKTNERSKSFSKYFDLLTDESLSYIDNA